MLVDLSHAVEDGMVTYPGLPGPRVTDFLGREESAGRYAPGTTFHIGRIDLVANTGTYLDAPFHRFADGADLAALPLERLADLEGVVVDGAGRRIDREAFAGLALAGRAVLVRTGWSRHWRTPAYAVDPPHLTAAAARLLVDAGARLVGIDALNVDDPGDPARPVHTQLLQAGIPIVEHLTRLAELPARGFRFHAVPVKVRGLGTFPVRAYAVTS